MEEERRKEKEKALLAERKAAQIEAVKAATVAAIQKETEAKKQKTGGSVFETLRPLNLEEPSYSFLLKGTRKSRAKESEEEATAEDGGGVGGEEWWERKDRRRAEELAAAAAGRSTSPVIPSLGRRNEQIVDSGLSSENGDKENSPQQEEREYVGDHRFSPSSSRARSLNPRNPRRNNVPSRRDSNESFSSGFSGGGNDRRSKSYSRFDLILNFFQCFRLLICLECTFFVNLETIMEEGWWLTVVELIRIMIENCKIVKWDERFNDIYLKKIKDKG
jgi:hypothetical protein